MNVNCPECRSVFRVDPAKVPGRSVRARCSVCGGVITIAAGADERAEFMSAPPASQPVQRQVQLAPASMQTAPAAARPVTPTPAPRIVPPAAAPAPPSLGTPTRPAPAVPRPTPLGSPMVPAAGAPPARPAAPPFMRPPVGAPVGGGAPPFVGGGPMVAPRIPVMPPRLAGAPAAPFAPRPQAAPPSAGIPSAAPAAPPAVPAAAPPAVVSASPVAAAPAPPAPVASTMPRGPAAGTPPARPPINPFLANDPNAKAKRLARALVSDIVAYFPQKREEGVRDGTLKQLFREEIKKSYEEYVEQVGREFAESTTHFQDALNDVLAGGKKLF
jgi:predicted Zn finger-like uncharacterized protein